MDRKMNKRITSLENNSYIYQDTDCLSSPYVKNASNNIHKDYVVVPIYKTNENIFLRKDHLPLLLLKNQD